MADEHRAGHAEFKGNLWWRKVRVVCQCGAASPWILFRPSPADSFQFSVQWFDSHRQKEATNA